MRRRAFLAGIPAGVGLTGLPAETEVPGSSTVTIVRIGTLHPRVRRAVDDLTADLRGLKYSITAQDQTVAGAHNRIVIATTEKANWGNLEAAGWQSVSSLPPEHFKIESKSGAIFILGGDSRGLVYALSHLRRAIDLQRGLPSSIAVERRPAFAVRRWSTAVSHNMGSPWDERIHFAQRLAYIKSELLHRAGEFGMNSLELNGRPGDGWDIAWVIGFEKYPELASLFSKGERRERTGLVEDLARAAHDNLLELLVWNHELYLPPGFVELYPQAKGVDYPVCLSSEFVKKFIRDKYAEFFEGAPSVDGVVISVNESGQFSLITDAGCRCDRCSRLSQHERLMAVLGEVIAVTDAMKKRIVVRTFQAAFIHDLHGHPELETIRKAFTGLPKTVQVMSKYCPLDFYGGQIADETLIGVFPNQHLVEFSLDVEWQGRTFVPVLTPDNFRRRIEHALEKKCAGIVARVDFPFPSMEPGTIFGHPNEFNAVYLGELLWEPRTDVDRSLADWARLQYGSESAAVVASVLRKTEEITQKTFFSLGHTLINYHNMIASVSVADSNLWTHALSKWNAKEPSESFFSPSYELINSCKAEKRRAVMVASECLSALRDGRKHFSDPQYECLRYGFEKLRDTAELWGHLVELYLLHRQIAFSPPKPGLAEKAVRPDSKTNLPRLLSAARGAMLKAVEMEQRHGEDSWPVLSVDHSPASGCHTWGDQVSAYDFVHEVLRYYIAAVTGETATDKIEWQIVDTVLTVPEVRPDSTEAFWRRFVQWGRPGFHYEETGRATLLWPEGLKELRFKERNMTLIGRDSGPLDLPLPYPVQETSFGPTRVLTLAVRKMVTRLTAERQA